MSGGGSYGGGGGGGPDEGINCSTLRFRTSLNSPVPAVIATLKVKDELTLSQKKTEGPLLAIAPAGVAGSIAGSLLLQLLRCIEQGHDYKAIVVKVTGGNVEVEIVHT